jgi:hypothetical protein
MIVSDIIMRVRRIFGDEAAVQVTDDDVMRWINDGQVEIVKKNDGALQKTSLLNIVVNQAQYTMPTDMLILRSLRFKATADLSFNTLKYMSIQQFDEAIDGWDGTALSTGTPQFFNVYEGKATLFPIPDASSTSGLKVLYNQQPATVTTTSDALALPLIYHNSLVKYCMWMASLLDEDHEPAIMYREDFQNDINMLQTRETQEATTTYSTITVLADDM